MMPQTLFFISHQTLSNNTQTIFFLLFSPQQPSSTTTRRETWARFFLIIFIREQVLFTIYDGEENSSPLRMLSSSCCCFVGDFFFIIASLLLFCFLRILFLLLRFAQKPNPRYDALASTTGSRDSFSDAAEAATFFLLCEKRNEEDVPSMKSNKSSQKRGAREPICLDSASCHIITCNILFVYDLAKEPQTTSFWRFQINDCNIFRINPGVNATEKMWINTLNCICMYIMWSSVMKFSFIPPQHDTHHIAFYKKKDIEKRRFVCKVKIGKPLPEPNCKDHTCILNFTIQKLDHFISRRRQSEQGINFF